MSVCRIPKKVGSLLEAIRYGQVVVVAVGTFRIRLILLILSFGSFHIVLSLVRFYLVDVVPLFYHASCSFVFLFIGSLKTNAFVHLCSSLDRLQQVPFDFITKISQMIPNHKNTKPFSARRKKKPISLLISVHFLRQAASHIPTASHRLKCVDYNVRIKYVNFCHKISLL